LNRACLRLRRRSSRFRQTGIFRLADKDGQTHLSRKQAT
jgi:hypothetical protein